MNINHLHFSFWRYVISLYFPKFIIKGFKRK